MRPDSAQPDNTEPQAWLHVARWREYQHYRNRRLRWIKSYHEQLDNEDYLALTYHQRGVLEGLRLLYARRNPDSHATTLRGLAHNSLALGRQLGHRILTRDLEALNHAGFVVFSASKLLDNDAADASLDLREVRETREPREVQDQKPASEDELSPSAAAAYRTLREVAKPGYAEVKFTVARFATLAAKYPSLDLADQAERLADWERYGKGETRATRDGIVAFRNWLDKAAAPSPNGHVAEVDYPWLPGCEPKRV